MRSAIIAAAVLASTLAAAAPAGTVYVLPEPIDLKDAQLEAKAKSAAVKELEKRDGQWSMFLLAWLRRTPGGSQLEVAFFDKAHKKAEPDAFIIVKTQSTAKVFASSVSVADDAGLEAGHTYDLRIKKPGPKGETLASTTLTVKD